MTFLEPSQVSEQPSELCANEALTNYWTIEQAPKACLTFPCIPGIPSGSALADFVRLLTCLQLLVC